MESNDLRLLKRIIDYCDEIQLMAAKIHNSAEEFEADVTSQRAIAMDLLQIGVLAGKLSGDCRKTLHHIPWREIRATRNWIVHAYDDINQQQLWDTVQNDIPFLRKSLSDIAGPQTV